MQPRLNRSQKLQSQPEGGVQQCNLALGNNTNALKLEHNGHAQCSDERVLGRGPIHMNVEYRTNMRKAFGKDETNRKLCAGTRDFQVASAGQVP